MTSKLIFQLCVSVLIVKAVLSQCIPSLGTQNPCASVPFTTSLGYPSLGTQNSFASVPFTTPLGIPSLGTQTSCASVPLRAGLATVVPSAPIEVFLSSDNLLIDGCINVVGTLPFNGAVLIDGAVPNYGEVSAFYECGNGNIGIESSAIGTGTGVGYKPAPGYNTFGCGCV